MPCTTKTTGGIRKTRTSRGTALRRLDVLRCALLESLPHIAADVDISLPDSPPEDPLAPALRDEVDRLHGMGDAPFDLSTPPSPSPSTAAPPHMLWDVAVVPTRCLEHVQPRRPHARRTLHAARTPVL